MLALAGSLAAACAADPAPPAESSSTSDPAGRITSQMNCGPDSGKSVHPGVLTIATDDPAYPPWFVDNKTAARTGRRTSTDPVVTKLSASSRA